MLRDVKNGYEYPWSKNWFYKHHIFLRKSSTFIKTMNTVLGLRVISSNASMHSGVEPNHRGETYIPRRFYNDMHASVIKGKSIQTFHVVRVIRHVNSHVRKHIRQAGGTY